MNLITASNVAVFTVGVTALASVVEFLNQGKTTEAIVAGVIGLAAVYLYERLPLSNPPTE